MPYLRPQAEGELFSYFRKSDFLPKNFTYQRWLDLHTTRNWSYTKSRYLLLPKLGTLHYVVQERAWGTKAPSNSKNLYKNSPFHAFWDNFNHSSVTARKYHSTWLFIFNFNFFNFSIFIIPDQHNAITYRQKTWWIKVQGYLIASHKIRKWNKFKRSDLSYNCNLSQFLYNLDLVQSEVRRLYNCVFLWKYCILHFKNNVHLSITERWTNTFQIQCPHFNLIDHV